MIPCWVDLKVSAGRAEKTMPLILIMTTVVVLERILVGSVSVACFAGVATWHTGCWASPKNEYKIF